MQAVKAAERESGWLGEREGNWRVRMSETAGLLLSAGESGSARESKLCYAVYRTML